jgi:hypothetical protein
MITTQSLAGEVRVRVVDGKEEENIEVCFYIEGRIE